MKVALLVLVVLGCAMAALTPEGARQRVVIREENTYALARAGEWVDAGPAGNDGEMRVYLYLKQRNVALAQDLLDSRSDPSSPLYGKFLSYEQVQRFFSPTRAQRLVVDSWLRRHRLRVVADHGDQLAVEGNVRDLEDAFATAFHRFHRAGQPKKAVFRHVGEFSLPHAVAQVVEFVTGVAAFPVPAGARKGSQARQIAEDGMVVPLTMYDLYSIPQNLVSGINNASSICLAEFQDDTSFNPDDLTFFDNVNSLPQAQFPSSQIEGSFDPNFPDAEATLDVQYGSAMAYNPDGWYFTVRGWMLEFVTEFLNLAATGSFPSAVSMSWGWTENQQCDITECADSEAYVNRCNVEFQKIVLMGVTVFASSGDQGAPGDANPECFNLKEPLSAIYPGVSPYITSVGATMMERPPITNNVVAHEQPAANSAAYDFNNPEICVDQGFTCVPTTYDEVTCSYPTALITSGGGFSFYSNRESFASWQNTVVSNYLASVGTLPEARYFNASNRGFPDVSSLGHNFAIRIDDTWLTVDGTSCSSPSWAGMLALLNMYRLNNGCTVLGYINPLLYQMAAANPATFNDITSGNNYCTEDNCCSQGYDAFTNWDAATGLGSPNFGAILDYVEQNVPCQPSTNVADPFLEAFERLSA